MIAFDSCGPSAKHAGSRRRSLHYQRGARERGDFEVIGQPLFDRRRVRVRHQLSMFRAEEAEQLLERGHAHALVELEHAEDLLGPHHLVGLDLELPPADHRHLLCALEETLLPLELAHC